MQRFCHILFLFTFLTLSPPTQAMDFSEDDSRIKTTSSIVKLLEESENFKNGDLLLIDVDGTLFMRKICPTKYNLSSPEILNRNKVFLKLIKKKYGPETYEKVKEIGNEVPSLGEKTLPKVLNAIFQERGIQVFPFTNRNFTRTEETEGQLTEVGYQLSSFCSSSASFGVVGDHVLKQGILYKNYKRTKDSCEANKGLGIVAILAQLRKKHPLSPPSIHFIDEKLVNHQRALKTLREAEAKEDEPFRNIYFYHYVAAPRFDTPEKLEAYYKENLPDYIEKYKDLFDKAFYDEMKSG